MSVIIGPRVEASCRKQDWLGSCRTKRFEIGSIVSMPQDLRFQFKKSECS